MMIFYISAAYVHIGVEVNISNEFILNKTDVFQGKKI